MGEARPPLLRPLSLMLRLDLPNEANVPQSPFLFSLALAKLARSLRISAFQQHGKRLKHSEKMVKDKKQQQRVGDFKTEMTNFSCAYTVKCFCQAN